LDIKHSIGGIALGKDGLALLQLVNRPAQAGFGEKGRWLKSCCVAATSVGGFHTFHHYNSTLFCIINRGQL
jgi:hypothetical protein